MIKVFLIRFVHNCNIRASDTPASLFAIDDYPSIVAATAVHRNITLVANSTTAQMTILTSHNAFNMRTINKKKNKIEKQIELMHNQKF